MSATTTNHGSGTQTQEAPTGAAPTPPTASASARPAPSWMPWVSLGMAIAGFIAAGLASVTTWGARYGSQNAELGQLRRDVDAQQSDKAELRVIGATLGRVDERMKGLERRMDGLEQGLREIRVDLRQIDKKR